MRASRKILVVDDEKNIIDSLKNILESSGYEVLGVYTTEQALQQLDNEKIDLVITEVQLNGAKSLNLLKYIAEGDFGIDVIALSSHTELETVREAMREGVYDFIAKPFRVHDVLFSVQRALEKRSLVQNTRELKQNMEKKIKEQTLSLHLRNTEKQQLLISTIRSLVSALEAKDKYTEGHSRRVADNALLMSQHLGFSTADCEEVHLAGLLHDIGKIGITETVLNKKGQLTTEEFDLIKTHPLISQKIVEQIPQFKRIAKMVRHHHEFWDGSGYPDGLNSNKIPIGARIMTICDAYDAMTSDRSYRAALSDTRALNIIHRNGNSQFDPDLVEIFLKMKGFKQ